MFHGDWHSPLSFGDSDNGRVVLGKRGMQLRDNMISQRIRRDDAHFGTMPQDVHHELAIVAVGDAQLVAAVDQKLPHLFGVPSFIGDPSGPLGRKTQHGFLVRLA